MKAYIQFAEDYLDLILDICDSIKKKQPNCIFTGITIRRKTCQKKIEKIGSKLQIEKTLWLNDIELNILNNEENYYNIEKINQLIGSRNIRQIISADREIGRGFLSGGIQEQTPLTKKIKINPELRQKLIYGMLSYYLDQFEKNRPDFIFLNEITFYWELIIYHVARTLNIPCLTLLYLRPTEHYMITDNPFEKNLKIEENYRLFLADPQKASQYIKQAEDRYSVLKDHRPVPLASRQLKSKLMKQITIMGFVKTLFTDIAKCIATIFGLAGTKAYIHQNSSFEILLTNIRKFKLIRSTIKNRSIFESYDNFKNNPYIFYPLHVEPESSILVRSDKFTNQLVLIEQIAKNMPQGYKLLVKEHLPMLGKRPGGFYDRIKSIPDVYLISPLENSANIVKNSKLVAVLTGTAGWEAIIQGIPALIIGHAQYDSINYGYYHSTDIINLDDVIIKSMKIPPATKQQIILYIAAILASQTAMRRKDFSYYHYGEDYNAIKSDKGTEQIADQILSYILSGD